MAVKFIISIEAKDSAIHLLFLIKIRFSFVCAIVG